MEKAITVCMLVSYVCQKGCNMLINLRRRAYKSLHPDCGCSIAALMVPLELLHSPLEILHYSFE